MKMTSQSPLGEREPHHLRSVLIGEKGWWSASGRGYMSAWALRQAAGGMLTMRLNARANAAWDS